MIYYRFIGEYLYGSGKLALLTKINTVPSRCRVLILADWSLETSKNSDDSLNKILCSVRAFVIFMVFSFSYSSAT